MLFRQLIAVFERLRNANSKLIECMRSVVAKGLSNFGYQHRILMTGTPLQNNTAELFSLLNFIEPAKFPDAEKFAQRFGVIQTQEQVEGLQRRIAPHLLRRVKEDVAKDIPPKEETIIDVELTTMQKQFYRAIYERNLGFLMQSLKSGSMPKLMNIQMELRKCCNHPFLIQGVEDTEMERLDQDLQEKLASSSLRAPKKFDRKAFVAKRMEEFMIPQSGKMVLLDKLLPKLKKEDHKVLIFSQMVKMIDYIEEFCDFRGYPCERLDGRVSGNDRQKAIDRFNRDSNSFVFLLSTRAGGVGINLTAADTVIIFDSDWNPQNDVQAMARCHRIGQKKRVTIYRLITRRSFEAEMFEKASKKLGLEQAVLGSRQFNDQDIEDNNKSSAKMDAKEMEQLLREGAYAVLLEENEEESKAFYNQDIDSILEQRTHVLVSETAPTTENWLNKMPAKKARARKSMFTGENAMEHAEIDVNDPDFWKKVLPDLVTPDIMLERLSDHSLLDDNGDADRDSIDKYIKDLGQMMDGMLDLHRRGNLPDRERTICLKLLLRMSMKDEIFEEDERAQAQEWYGLVEGSRKRVSRPVVSSPQSTSKGRGKQVKAPPPAKRGGTRM
jgi:superfamily II DNA or RNA helicase